MTFIYPAVFTPHKDGKGFHVEFPGLADCTADGPDLEGAIENAKEAAYNWICVELEEEEPELPEVSHVEDMELDEKSFVRQLMIVVKLLPDND